MRLACLVEDRFDIDLTDKELSTATSVQRLVAVVEEKLRRHPEIRAS
jgi:acyl carrier protein